MISDIKDFNTRYVDHPKYVSNKIIEKEAIEVIAQKIEMILYTNKGEVMSDPDMGADLEYYLWSTSVPVEFIQMELKNQFDKFIPELNKIEYTLTLDLYQGTVRDILYINIGISDKNIKYIFQ